jgi:hypothetical protein
MSVERCSLKLRFFTLVVNTADLINERATPTLGISHAIISPVAIFTTYIFIGILVVGAMRQQFASYFLEIYAIISCCALHTYLSIVVFSKLAANADEKHSALFLNGVLPMLIIFILLADLIVILFSNRNIGLPVLPQNTPEPSRSSVPSTS